MTTTVEKKKDVLLVCCDESYLQQMLLVLEKRNWDLRIRVDVMNSHDDLKLLATTAFITDYYLVAIVDDTGILPRMFKLYLCHAKYNVNVVAVGFCEQGGKILLPSQFEIPGQSIILKENGEAYMGSDGLYELLCRAEKGEIASLQKTQSLVKKPAKMAVWQNFDSPLRKV